MESKNRSTNKEIAIMILTVLLLVSFVFNVYNVDSSKPSQDNQLEFFNNYVIAINDYHVGMEMFSLASANSNLGDWYSSTDEYYYEDAIDLYSESNEQLAEAKEFIIHGKQKLGLVKDKSPNYFYENEIDKRIQQISISMDLIDKYYLLNDYSSKELYEINYGSETEATRYFNMYNDLTIEVNKDLVKLSNVSQEIDWAWDSNWYPLLEGI